MKNKYKILSILLIFSFIFTGCSINEKSPIESNQFNVVFDSIDYEQSKASFTVTGYPNDEELQQLSIIINDSINSQKVNEDIKVYVYSDLQDTENKPFFGEYKFKNGSLTSDIVIPTSEEYIELSNS